MFHLPEPHKNNSYYMDRIVSEIGKNIFVFGSNLSGIHGLGGARTALRRYGALYGKGIGLHGQSYAIPTKDRQIKTLELSVIEGFIEDFVIFTKENPKLTFFVTPIGTGLAGYRAEDIAPFFKGSINCWFPDSWKHYLKD